MSNTRNSRIFVCVTLFGVLCTVHVYRMRVKPCSGVPQPARDLQVSHDKANKVIPQSLVMGVEPTPSSNQGHPEWTIGNSTTLSTTTTSTAATTTNPTTIISTTTVATTTLSPKKVTFPQADLHRKYDFNINGNDVMVFVHIQKTGGRTFDGHLIRNVKWDIPCVCGNKGLFCHCLNRKGNTWLFAGYSMQWRCGLHADWTEIKANIERAMDKEEKKKRDRRYLYITYLRRPITRYLSEYQHMKKGADWTAAALQCDGREATQVELPPCFEGRVWKKVTMDEFLSCPSNLATNRQTRMLANLELVGCYNKSFMRPAVRNRVMLKSAKTNLQSMAYFGLTEYQRESQYMFERTFNLKFMEDFQQWNETHANNVKYTPQQMERIVYLNRLDLELYKFAEELFLQRLWMMMEEDGIVPGENFGVRREYT